VTIDNFYALFDGVLNPKQLEGLRLLVTPFPQQQFNATGRPTKRQAEPRRGLLRLPRERPHECRDPHRSATSDRTSTGIASTPRRSAA
jgi:hypothetical protein